MEKKDVLLSVIVPVRDRAGVVRDTLDSIAGQIYRAFELIVVDNGSSDGTPAVLEAWKNENAGGLSVRIESCGTPGAAAARNYGLALATAPWVMFFDSDDIMLPGHLKSVAEAIAAHPEADIIGWDVVMERGGKRRTGAFYGRSMIRHNLFDGAMATQRWAARTGLVRAVGGWDEAVGYWDDIELGARLLARTDRICYTGLGGVIVRESRESISSAGARDPESMEPALTRIEKTLGGAKGRRWCRLKRAVEYARYTRSGLLDGKRCMEALKPSLFLWAAYHYTRLGGRGIARLMRF